MEIKYRKISIKSIEKDRTALLKITDDSVDRDKDIIEPGGGDHNTFMETGAILYGHNANNLPLGKPINISEKGNAIWLKIKFADMGTDPFIDAVTSLVNQKILRGVSIGFLPIEYTYNEYGGNTFLKWELIEVSLTPVPSNRNALIMSKNFDKDILDKLLYKNSSVFKLPEGLTKEQIEILKSRLSETVKTFIDDDQVSELLKSSELFLKASQDFKNILNGGK